MKKIVGIFAAAAVLATSVFAADVSATAKVKSTLFNSKDGAISLLGTIENNQTAGHITLFTLSTSSDNAGGTVKYWGDGNKVVFGGYTVWYKPTDALKLSYKENALELFGDKYNGWYAHNVAGSNAGYGLQIAADALTFDVVVKDGFMTKAKDADPVIGQIGAKVSYAADFGSIAAVFSYAGESTTPAVAAKKAWKFNDETGLYDHDAKNDTKAADAVKNPATIEIGAGFSGNFDAVGVVFNAGAKIAGETTTVGINPSAGGSIDALGWALDVPVTLTLASETTTALGLNAKASYALDPAKFTLYFEDANLLADGDFAAKIGCAIEGSVGAASWKVDPSFDTGKKEFNVALETGISF